MRTRDKQRIFRRFMAGEPVSEIASGLKTTCSIHHERETIENILREGATGKFDPLPMKQARVLARE